MRNILIGDFGWGFWKTCSTKKMAHKPNALTPLADANYENALKFYHGRPGTDVVRVNGQAYVIGDQAENAGEVIKPKGAGRYTRDYAGTVAAIACGLLFPDSSDNVVAFLAHPAEDITYQEDLKAAVRGRWSVTIDGDERSYHIREAGAYPEPLGGLMHVRLSEGGKPLNLPDLAGFGYIVDIGMHTVQGLPVKENGLPDWTGPRLHLNIGIGDALDNFKDQLRASFADELRNIRQLRPRHLREALTSNRYPIGGGFLECENEVTQATSMIINRIRDAIQQQAGGALSYQYILLTGGGAALLAKRLIPQALEGHDNVRLSEDADNIVFANMWGGLKIARSMGL